MAGRDKGTSEQQTLSRTLEFLKTMAMSCAELSVNEIADELKVSKPTAYSIVNSLVAQNYLEKNPDSGKYHIGYSFYVMGHSYPRLYPFLIYAENYAIQLYEKLRMRVNICVFKPPMTALVIASKDSSLVARHVNGYVLPAHLSASGKVLLASLDQDKAMEYISSSELYSFTSKTITSPERLMEELSQVRAKGYATDIEEFVPGHVCISAPVKGAKSETVCSISLSRCPLDRCQAEGDKLIAQVKSTAMQISLDLGYPREYNMGSGV